MLPGCSKPHPLGFHPAAAPGAPPALEAPQGGQGAGGNSPKPRNLGCGPSAEATCAPCRGDARQQLPWPRFKHGVARNSSEIQPGDSSTAWPGISQSSSPAIFRMLSTPSPKHRAPGNNSPSLGDLAAPRGAAPCGSQSGHILGSELKGAQPPTPPLCPLAPTWSLGAFFPPPRGRNPSEICSPAAIQVGARFQLSPAGAAAAEGRGAQRKVNKGLLFQLLGGTLLLAPPLSAQGVLSTRAGKGCKGERGETWLATRGGVEKKIKTKKNHQQPSRCTEVIRGTEQIIGEANNAF